MTACNQFILDCFDMNRADDNLQAHYVITFQVFYGISESEARMKLYDGTETFCHWVLTRRKQECCFVYAIRAELRTAAERGQPAT
jgi:hypothetical protein